MSINSMDMKKNKIEDMADVCEEAHKRTVMECEKKNIPVDCDNEVCDEHMEDSIHYSNKAQLIFDRHYDEIIEETGL